MNAEYDVFEILSDNSLTWRTCAQGRLHALEILNAVGKQTSNACFVIDLKEQKIIGGVNDGDSTSQIITNERSCPAFS